MKYVLRRVVVVGLVFAASTIKPSQELYQEIIEQGPFQLNGRSYHAATYDTVTGVEHSPFVFTTSSLGQSLRATSFLLGHLYAAAEDSSVRDQMMDDMEDFCEKILNLYVLCHEALRSVSHQLHDAPEKSSYLVEEIEHLQQRIMVLSDCFEALVETAQSHEISTVLVTLRIIINKTRQMLAV